MSKDTLRTQIVTVPTRSTGQDPSLNETECQSDCVGDNQTVADCRLACGDEIQNEADCRRACDLDPACQSAAYSLRCLSSSSCSSATIFPWVVDICLPRRCVNQLLAITTSSLTVIWFTMIALRLTHKQ